MKFYVLPLLFLLTSLTTAQIKVDEQIISPGVVYKKITNTVDTLSIDILKIEISSGDYVINSHYACVSFRRVKGVRNL